MSSEASIENSRATQSSGGISLGLQLGYGVGQVAGQVFRDVPSLLLLFFMTTVLGISPATAGTAIFVPKLVWGVGSDLLVGVLSDRWQRKIERRWWLLVGVLGAPTTMLLLFHVPDGSLTLRLLYVAGVFSLYMAVFACFSVPYLAIASELTSSPRQRNTIMAWRLAFTSVGLLVSGALAPGIVQSYGGGQQGYEMMAVALAVICPLCLLVTFYCVGRATPEERSDSEALRVRLSFREAITVLLNRRFSVLLFSNTLLLIGSGMGYAAMLYFYTYNMGRSDALEFTGRVFMFLCIGIVIAQPVWVRLSDWFGKRISYLIGAAIYAVAYLCWAFAAKWPDPLLYLLAVFSAIGNSGWAMLGFSMVADISSDDQKHAGLYSAVWIASDKIAFALGGTLLVGLVLSAFGFDSANAVAGLPQTEAALTGVMVAYGLSPALLTTMGGVIFYRWGRDR